MRSSPDSHALELSHTKHRLNVRGSLNARADDATGLGVVSSEEIRSDSTRGSSSNRCIQS